jgi:hypothetical protein
MAQGLFIGLEEADLLALRKTAVDAMKKGLVVVSYSDSGSSVSKQWALPPKEMLDEAGYALYNLDPQQYAAFRRTSVVAVRWDSRIF